MDTGEILRDRYELRERISRGGMGEVWLAFDRRLEREVAIKVGSAEAGTPELLAEGRAAAQLDHPNIVSVHDVDTHEGEPFIVMEYVAGPSLRTRLRNEGRLSVAEALRTGQDILRALTYAHGRGVWHNDVKPENILIARDGTARLSDFGIASVNATTVDLDTMATRWATPAYASPELLAGSPPGMAADLYAAAMTIYECVAGVTPARDPAQPGGPPAFVPPLREIAPQAPEELERVLERALDPDPAARYGSALALRNALERPEPGTHATVPIAAAARPRPARRRPSHRRHSGWRAAMVGALATGILGLGAIGVFAAMANGGIGGSPQPTATPTSTATPTATSTPTATATPSPTATATPSPTATPEPTAPPTSTPEVEPEPDDQAGNGSDSRWRRLFEGLGEWAGSAWDDVWP